MRLDEPRSRRGEAGDGPAQSPHLRAECALPKSVSTERGNVLFVYGSCFHEWHRLRGIRLLLDGEPIRPQAQRMPRLDVFARAPSAPSYRSGFWAFVPLPADGAPGDAELWLEAELPGGSLERRSLGRIARRPRAVPHAPDSTAAPRPASVAICMATFDPEIALFDRQIESIREQTLDSWVCVISDDCTPPERFAEMTEVLAGDPRFLLVRSEERLGFYRNFERALGLAPAEARYVALADQDDRWRREKLETLVAALGSAQLVYSDARVLDAGGNVLSDTYWTRRRTNHTNLASLLVANTITGAASLFRRELLSFALPFPNPPGRQYHDHWLAIVALALGRIAYVDEPLYDYVQHERAALGHAGANVDAADRRARAAALRALGMNAVRRFVAGWRTSYFYDHCRLQLLARVVLLRCGPRLERRKRRALRLFLATERSPLALAWLALRPLRRWLGRDETLGGERLLARGVLWRRLVPLTALGRDRPPRWWTWDASLPTAGLDAPQPRRDAGDRVRRANRVA